MKPLIKITDNSLHTLIDNSETDHILLCNLTDINEEIVAEVWWSGAEHDKNLYLLTQMHLTTYVFFGISNPPYPPFIHTYYDSLPGTLLWLNGRLGPSPINTNQITHNATLSLDDDTCVGFDASVVRVNQKSWQCMLKADAVTKFVEKV